MIYQTNSRYCMQKIKVGIFFGGISPEHEVSLSSAYGIISNMDKKRFEIIEVFIDKKGDFWTGKEIASRIITGSKAKLNKIDFNLLSNKIDVAFPILHGEMGEDGTIQGFFKILKIPFVGPDVLASSVCLDKAILNQLTEANGILNPKFEGIDYERENSEEIKFKLTNIENSFKLPLFVKPARTGSSVGISKIKRLKELKSAINEARKFDNKIIIEESIENCKEIEVSILGDNIKNFKVSFPGRVIPGEDFYDYNDKYKSNKARFEIPANFSKKVEDRIKKIALESYKIANCKGMARVDLFLDNKNKIYLNEINTIPGFTPISMYPKMWEASGLSYRNLITKLIELALNKS